MKFKFLIVLTIVLSALCVLPVNADFNFDDTTIPNNYDLGTNPTNEYCVFSVSSAYNEINIGIIHDNNLIMFSTNNDYIHHSYYNHIDQWFINIQNINNAYGNGEYYIYADYFDGSQIQYLWKYTYSNISEYDYDINVDSETNNIELGRITNNQKILSIGSNTLGLCHDVTVFDVNDIIIDVLLDQSITVTLRDDKTQGNFKLRGKNTDNSDFETIVNINYNLNEIIQFQVECIDYDKGIQVIGNNLTVYYYKESDNQLSDIVYHNSDCNGLENIEVFNNSILFLEYNLNGYNAVNIDTYEFINNRQGKLIDSNLKSARLYFSKIDPSVLLFQGFIIKDSLGNALSGVSVTMDNNQTVISNQYGGVRFDNINQGSHTFVFSKTGYYSQSLTKTVSVSNTQDILLVSSQPTTAPTVKPTPLQTDSQGNIIIEKPSNLSDSIKYGLAKIFGITSLDSINLIFALILILFPAVIGGTITNQALGFISGGMIGFVFALAVGLIPIWVFFSMVMFAVIYLILTHSNDGF